MWGTKYTSAKTKWQLHFGIFWVVYGKGHLGKRQSIADSQSFFSQTVADRILLYSSAGLKWEYTSTRAHMQPTLNNKTDRHAPTWME